MTININRSFHGWGHQFLWSAPMLMRAVTAVGFGDVRFVTFGESDDPILHAIERHHPFNISDGLPSVWVVEATRAAVDLPPIDPDFLAHVERDYLRYVR